MEVAQPSTFMLSSSLRSLSSDYLALLGGGPDRFADIAFCIDGRADALVYAHRCILSARSPFFRLIFSSSSSSSNSSSSNSSISVSISASASCDSSESCDSPPAPRNQYMAGSISMSQCYPNQIVVPSSSSSSSSSTTTTTTTAAAAANSPTGILLSNWEAGAAAQLHGDIDVIPVDIVSYDAFVAMIRFLYTGQLIIDPSATTEETLLGPSLPLTYNPSSATATATIHPMSYYNSNVDYNYNYNSNVHYAIHICLELIHAANFFGVDELCALAQAKLGLVLQINNDGGSHSVSLEDIASVLIVARKHKLNRLWLSATELLVAQHDPGSSFRSAAASINEHYYYYYHHHYYELLHKYLPRDALSELMGSIEMLLRHPSPNHGLMLTDGGGGGGGGGGGARISSNLLNNCNAGSYTNYNNDHHIHSNVMNLLSSNILQTGNHDGYLYTTNFDSYNSNVIQGSCNNYILGSNNSSLITTPFNGANTRSGNKYGYNHSLEAEAVAAAAEAEAEAAMAAMAETSEMMRLKQGLECMDMEMVRMMAMGEGVDLNAAEALHYAVMRCSREVVKALLEMQGLVDVNHRIGRRGPGPGSVGSVGSVGNDDDDDDDEKQHSGMSALHLAAMMGSADMIAVLLDHHADPTATTDGGLSPLDILRAHIQPTPTPTQQPTGHLTHHAHAHANAMKPCPAGHELMPPLPVRSSNPPVLSKAEHKRILLCIELIQSAAAVAEREDHEPDPDPEPRVENHDRDHRVGNDGDDDDDVDAGPAHSPISSTVTSVQQHHHHHHHPPYHHDAKNVSNHHGHLVCHDHQGFNAHHDLMSIDYSTSNDVGIAQGCISSGHAISYVDHHHHHLNHHLNHHLPTLAGSSS